MKYEVPTVKRIANIITVATIPAIARLCLRLTNFIGQLISAARR